MKPGAVGLTGAALAQVRKRSAVRAAVVHNTRYSAIRALLWCRGEIHVVSRCSGTEDLSGICRRVAKRRRFAKKYKELGNRGRCLHKKDALYVFREIRKSRRKTRIQSFSTFFALSWTQKLDDTATSLPYTHTFLNKGLRQLNKIVRKLYLETSQLVVKTIF